MPSHQDNLAAVRAACVAANQVKLGNTLYGIPVLDYVPPEPELSDVLLALEEKNRGHYAIDARGELLAWGNYYATGGRWQEIGITLDLRANLSGWSEEAVAALAALLKRDD